MSANAVDPATLFGFGTWEQIKDTFLLASGDNHLLASTGGEESHLLTVEEMPTHTHPASTDNIGGHAHSRGSQNITGYFNPSPGDNNSQMLFGNLSNSVWNGAFYPQGAYNQVIGDETSNKYYGARLGFSADRAWSGSTSTNGSHAHTITMETAGSNTEHNNMPPYLAVNVWKRIA